MTIHVTLAAGHKVLVTFTAVVSKTDTANVKNTATITTGPCIPSTQCTSTVTNPVPNFTVKKTDVPGTGKPVVQADDPLHGHGEEHRLGSGLGGPNRHNRLEPGHQGHNGQVHNNRRHRRLLGDGHRDKVTIHVTLAAGHKVLVTFTAVVSKTDTANVKNTATITTGPCIPSTQCTSTVTNPVPNFTVKKTDVPGTGKAVVPGSTIPYTVTVKNTGSGAGSAVLTDTIASNLAIKATTVKCTTIAVTDACSATVTGTKVTIHVTLAAATRCWSPSQRSCPRQTRPT